MSTSNEGNTYGLTVSPQGLILNKFTIYGIFGRENLANYLVG